MLASAQALHLMPTEVGASGLARAGRASGAPGFSLEEYKLLADSDSESDAELEALCAAVPAAPPAAPPMRQAKEAVEAGPGHKYKWEALKQTSVEKEALPGFVGCGPARDLMPELPAPEEEEDERASNQAGWPGRQAAQCHRQAHRGA